MDMQKVAQEKLEMDMTPMIDCVFLLMIFFVLVIDLSQQSLEDLILPDRETLERWMTLDLGKAQSLVPPRLILPHPRMQERSFVLAPMAEIAPDWRHPATGQTVTRMLAARPAAERETMQPAG